MPRHNNLNRFINAQKSKFPEAKRQLKTGIKTSDWMWHVFPQYKGLGTSGRSKKFAISSIDEAKAYLAHPILGPRLREGVALVNTHSHKSSEAIFGRTDSKKFRSSLTLFSEAASSRSDKALFNGALKTFFNGRPDGRTKLYLKQDRPYRSAHAAAPRKRDPYISKVIADTADYWRGKSSPAALGLAFNTFDVLAEKIWYETKSHHVKSDQSTGPAIKKIVHETFDSFVNKKSPNALKEFKERYRSVLTTGRDLVTSSAQRKDAFVFKVIADTANYWNTRDSRADLSLAYEKFNGLAEKIWAETQSHHVKSDQSTGPAIRKIVRETFESFVKGSNPDALKEFEERYRSLLTTGKDRSMHSSFTFKPASEYSAYHHPLLSTMRTFSFPAPAEPFVYSLRRASREYMRDLQIEKSVFGKADNRLGAFIDDLMDTLKQETKKLEHSMSEKGLDDKQKDLLIDELEEKAKKLVEKARVVAALCDGGTLKGSPDVIERIFDKRLQLSDEIVDHLSRVLDKKERTNLGMANKDLIPTGKILAGKKTGTHCLVESGKNTLKLVEAAHLRKKETRTPSVNQSRR